MLTHEAEVVLNVNYIKEIKFIFQYNYTINFPEFLDFNIKLQNFCLEVITF